MEFKIYKSGQGYYTRMGTAIAAAAILLLGCWRLFEILGAADITNANTRLFVQIGVPLVIVLAGGFFVWWLMNKPFVADFLIAGEGEMKKVNWSSRKEIIASTMVVIFTVVAMSCLMALTDVFFQFFFRAIKVIQ